MNLDFLKKLALVSITFIAFSCEKEDQNVLETDTLRTKSTEVNKDEDRKRNAYDVNVSFVTINGGEAKLVTTKTLERLNVIATNTDTGKKYPIVQRGISRTFRNLPAGEYTFKSDIIFLNDYILESYGVESKTVKLDDLWGFGSKKFLKLTFLPLVNSN